MKKKIVSVKIVLLLTCCSNFLFVSKSFSQDFHLSQFDAFAQYLNPAMTGMFNGDYRANLHIRRQWSSVIPNPYYVTGIGFDMPRCSFLKNPQLSQIKIGGYITNEQAGSSKFSKFSFALSGAYDLAIKNTNNHIAAGLQLGFLNKSINTSNLLYPDNYSDQNGGGFSSSNPGGETFSNTNVFLPDFNFGAMYYYGNVKSRLNPFLGGSVFHISQPKDNFLNQPSTLPRRFNVNGGTKINIARRHQANLYALMMKQGNVTEYDANIMGMSFIRDRDDVCLLYGFGYRTFSKTIKELGKQSDATIIHLGIKYGNITGRVSYDFNISGLKIYSNGRGGFEFSLVYIHNKPIKIPTLTCPRI